MKILFITDRNLTHDIRVFNELKFAGSLGHRTELIAFYDPWSEKIEKVHLDLAKPRHYYYLKNRKALLAKAISQIAKILYPLFKSNLWINAFSLDYRTALIWEKLNSLPKDYDLVVAHGFNSLFPAYAYARKYNKAFAFDAASFIPELDITGYDVERFHKNRLLFKRIIPFITYYTYSTDLVGLKLKKILSIKNLPDNFTISNSYPEEFFTFRPSVSEKVEFVWIGQRIDVCPDIEMILPTLRRFRDKIRLNIFGQVTDRFKQLYKDYSDFLVFYDPMPVDLLLKTLASFDVGLAVYLTYVSPEKNYTLSNKIFAYIQNGLYTIASDTISQRIFFSEYPQLGKIVLPNIEHLTEAIGQVVENISEIRQKKQERFSQARKFSWKYESHKLAEMWAKLQARKNEKTGF